MNNPKVNFLLFKKYFSAILVLALLFLPQFSQAIESRKIEKLIEGALSPIEKQNLIPIFEHLRTIVYSVVLFSIILSAILIIFENNTTLDKMYKKILPFKD